MVDIFGWTFLALIAGVFIWRGTSVGHHYIEFDGSRYWVWEQTFSGFNPCRGVYYSESAARERIKELESNSPRRIHT